MTLQHNSSKNEVVRPTPADCASGRVYAKKGSESYYSAFQQATYLPPQNTSSPKRRAFSRVLSHPPIFSCSLQLATRGMAHGGRGKLTGRMKQKDMDTRSLLEDGPRIAMGLTYGACVMHVRSRAIAGVGLNPDKPLGARADAHPHQPLVGQSGRSLSNERGHEVPAAPSRPRRPGPPAPI